ncbi:MAG: hypothetical protein LBB49_03500 [Gracilibacteraceae bacterium]|jgi:hypothetical protein|nr:hypothetical protein [Gracilibacteraceae bacterium]
MMIDRSKMTAMHGYFEGAADAVDQESAQKAIAYKKDVCKNFINVSSDQIDFRLGGSEFYVTRKYDGEMNVIFYDGAGDQMALINRSGRIRVGLACLEDARAALKAAGVGQAVLPGELYGGEGAGRTRVLHVLSALADAGQAAELRLAVFDILELDGVFRANSYGETHRKISDIFGGARLCGPVECRKCTGKASVKEIYTEWVEQGGAEGLVVRTELPLVYKVKPRHTIDVVAVGYSEGTGESKGQVRSLLLAMMPRPGEAQQGEFCNSLQIIGKTGNGFSDEARRDLLKRLEPLTVASEYIETDSNHVAFHMIKPELVLELMINDVLFDTSAGFIHNPVLGFEEGQYIRKGSVRGISVVFPIFVRFREDKQAVYEDIRLEQINEFSYVDPAAKVSALADLPASEVIRRVVYKKESGTKLMVQKFMVWRTNKQSDEYPGYVFHYTNFSSERKEPLQREVMVSDDEEQILELFGQSLTENVKKGWTEVGSS